MEEVQKAAVIREFLWYIKRLPKCIILRASSYETDTYRLSSYNFDVCVVRVNFCYRQRRWNHYYYEWHIPEDLVGGLSWDIYFYGPDICIRIALSMLSDFTTCQDEFTLNPADGVLLPYTFKWLGFIYYIHETTSLAHHSLSPRVVLIHTQFALGTAAELLRLPKNFKLGSVIFGDYERDEEECGLSTKQVRMGVVCPRAYFVIPYTVIIPHPEYTRFGIENSLAIIKLLRPVTSSYMVPICLPSLSERLSVRRNRTVMMIDYLSAVPLDIDIERMGKKTFKLYPFRECLNDRINKKFKGESTTHLLCTSGCGVRPGAPIIRHEAEGPFELIGLAFGSDPCKTEAMRRRKNVPPPVYIDVYPYVKWITSVISANIFPLPYARNYIVIRAQPLPDVDNQMPMPTRRTTTTPKPKPKNKDQRWGWKGRTFVTGNYCYKNSKHQRRTSLFYSETFEANVADTALTIFIKVSAGIETTITCARLLLPSHIKHTPIITGVGGFNITVQLDTRLVPLFFTFTLGLNGKNTTKKEIDDRWAKRGYGGMW